LDPGRLEKVRKLEEELGAYVVALEPEFRLAELTTEQLARLEVAEKELGVVLLAYEGG
jgi:alpha-ketoglutarate-dependent taurine dioxygenase